MLHLTRKPRLVLPPTFASPATRNRTRDHLIAAKLCSQMLCQLSYSQLVIGPPGPSHNLVLSLDLPCPIDLASEPAIQNFNVEDSPSLSS